MLQNASKYFKILQNASKHFKNTLKYFIVPHCTSLHFIVLHHVSQAMPLRLNMLSTIDWTPLKQIMINAHRNPSTLPLNQKQLRALCPH